MNRFARFVLVGALGFLVDFGLLALLLAATPAGPFLARLVSIAAAMTVTWRLNRSVTFGPSGRSQAAEGARYAGVGLGASLLNYLVYAGLLFAFPALPPLAALVCASAAAMAFSYGGYSRFVFAR